MRYKIGFGIFCIVVCFVFLVSNIVKGYRAQLGKLEYFINNEAYSFEYAEREDEDCVLCFDFDNPESVLGQTIYEKDGNRIVVSEIDGADESYVRISFEATGNYDDTKKEGSFISPVIALPDEENQWRIIDSLPEIAPAEEYRCSFASETCEYEKLTNRFSIYVTKISFLDNKEEAGDTDGIVTIRFSNLWEMKWHKKDNLRKSVTLRL